MLDGISTFRWHHETSAPKLRILRLKPFLQLVCLSVHLLPCLPTFPLYNCMLLYLCVYPFVYLSGYMSISFCLFFFTFRLTTILFLSDHLPVSYVCLSGYLSVCLLVCIPCFTFCLSVGLCIICLFVLPTAYSLGYECLFMVASLSDSVPACVPKWLSADLCESSSQRIRWETPWIVI